LRAIACPLRQQHLYTFPTNYKQLNHTYTFKIIFNIKNLSDSVENDFSNATDLADYLVSKDVPFRTAYQVVGEIVKYCMKRKTLFKNLKIEEFKEFHPEFDEDVFVDLKPVNVVKSRNSEGGTGFVQVEKEVNNWQKKLLL